MERERSRLQRCGLLVRNLLIATLAYTAVVEIVHVYQTGSLWPFAGATGKPAAPAGPEGSSSSSPSSSLLSGGVNWRLRPETLVTNINDAYLGPRPHVDTYANYSRLIQSCRGSAAGLEKMRNVYDCLAYLTHREPDYLYVPADRPPSRSSPDYPAVNAAPRPSRTSPGQCPGPVQLYHTYWTGPATWRVELFIKSYLHTQNLACSRLHLWLDSDTNPAAVADMMADPAFRRFLPLVDRGDIVLRAWRFPSRIPLPRGTIAQDPLYAGVLKSRRSGADESKSGGAAGAGAGAGSGGGAGAGAGARGSSGSGPSGGVGSPGGGPGGGAGGGAGETSVGDGLVIRHDGSEWIVLTERQMTFLPVAVSDAVRFIVLHLHGGVYLDMDILLLRDLRPLVLPPDHSFAERWAVHSHPGDFNTAVLSLSANSSLSSYLVRGGVRMGLNFHPRIVGRMAWKDGRVGELAMFETGLFDPIWGEFNWGREGRCPVPCFKDYGVAFLGTRDAIKDEWQSYAGPQLPLKDRLSAKTTELRRWATAATPATASRAEYVIEDDKYPPNNRTLENFFRGAWTYHIHNQVSLSPSLSPRMLTASSGANTRSQTRGST